MSIPPQSVLLKVVGNRRLKDVYFETQMHELLQARGELDQETLLRLIEAGSRNLLSGDLLDTGDISDSSSSSSSSPPPPPFRVSKNEKTGQWEATLDVTGREKNLLMLEVQASVQGDKGGGRETKVETTLALRSPIGYGEKFSVKVDQGTRSTGSLALDMPLLFQMPWLIKPFRSSSHGRLHATRNWEQRGAVQSLNITRQTYAFELVPTNLCFPSLSFGYEMTDEIPSMASGNRAIASPEVLNGARPTSKYFVRGQMSLFDTRCLEQGTTIGSNAQVNFELSTRFSKTEVDMTHETTIGHLWNWVVSGCSTLLNNNQRDLLLPRDSYLNTVGLETSMGLGLIRKGFSTPTSAPSFADRLYLGGPSNLRGFEHFGIGERSFPASNSAGGASNATPGSSSSSSLGKSTSNSNCGSSSGSTDVTAKLLWDRQKGSGAKGDALGGITKLAISQYVTFPFNIGNVAPADHWLASLSGLRALVGVQAGYLESANNWRRHQFQLRLLQSYLAVIPLETRVSGTIGIYMPVTLLGATTRLSLAFTVPLAASGNDNFKKFQISAGLIKF